MYHDDVEDKSSIEPFSQACKKFSAKRTFIIRSAGTIRAIIARLRGRGMLLIA